MIQRDEVVLKNGTIWLHFTKPHRIITADRLQDVLPALREIEDLVTANNWHAAGFLSYESASAFDKAHQTRPPSVFPLLWFGLYPAPHELEFPSPTTPKPALSWSPTVERDEYNAAIERIRQFIAEGRTYQVNYTMRLKADFAADPWEFFQHLAQGTKQTCRLYRYGALRDLLRIA